MSSTVSSSSSCRVTDAGIGSLANQSVRPPDDPPQDEKENPRPQQGRDRDTQLRPTHLVLELGQILVGLDDVLNGAHRLPDVSQGADGNVGLDQSRLGPFTLEVQDCAAAARVSGMTQL